MPYIYIYAHINVLIYAYICSSIYGNIYEQENIVIVKKEGGFF